MSLSAKMACLIRTAQYLQSSHQPTKAMLKERYGMYSDINMAPLPPDFNTTKLSWLIMRLTNAVLNTVTKSSWNSLPTVLQRDAMESLSTSYTGKKTRKLWIHLFSLWKNVVFWCCFLFLFYTTAQLIIKYLELSLDMIRQHVCYWFITGDKTD